MLQTFWMSFGRRDSGEFYHQAVTDVAVIALSWVRDPFVKRIVVLTMAGDESTTTIVKDIE